MKRPSLFFSILKAFFGCLSGVLGIFVGLIVVVIVLVAVSSTGGKGFDGPYQVLPDASGVAGELGHGTPLIMQLNIEGVIGVELLGSDSVAEQFERAQQEGFRDRIKALLLYINSPGGEVFATSKITRMVEEYKERFNLPVYVLTDGYCASGGFHIACAGDKIYATEVSLVGSVGVIRQLFNFRDTLDKIGGKVAVLSAGKGKDTLRTFTQWTDDEGKGYQSVIDNLYEQFVAVVLTNRPKLTREKLVDDYGAKLFNASIAAEYGYVDEIVEGRNEVLSKLAEEAGIEDYQVIQFYKPSWIESFNLSKYFATTPRGYLYLHEETLPY